MLGAGAEMSRMLGKRKCVFFSAPKGKEVVRMLGKGNVTEMSQIC